MIAALRASAAAALFLLAAAGPAPAEDRLARFAELGRQLSGSDAGATDDDGTLLEQMFALVDAEVLENLRSGAPFSSPEFIQERLDALMATWGGMRLRIVRLPGTGSKPPLVIGVLSVPGPSPRGSLRIYGRRDADDVRRLAARDHEGAPEIHAW